MSNAVKYAPFENGMVYISLWQEADEEGKIHLAIRDNGEGVPAEDLPFLFDKGFTGSHPDRQEATGMGLFLAQKFCQAISVDIFVEEDSISGQGFGIQLVFPKTVLWIGHKPYKSISIQFNPNFIPNAMKNIYGE